MHNKIEADISMVKKLIAVSRNKQEVLKTEYSKYTRTLHETEQQLNRAETVCCCLFLVIMVCKGYLGLNCHGLQGLKKVLSHHPGQVDFPIGQVTFYVYLPIGQGPIKLSASYIMILKLKKVN